MWTRFDLVRIRSSKRGSELWRSLKDGKCCGQLIDYQFLASVLWSYLEVTTKLQLSPLSCSVSQGKRRIGLETGNCKWMSGTFEYAEKCTKLSFMYD
jgi:hypothetical protein